MTGEPDQPDDAAVELRVRAELELVEILARQTIGFTGFRDLQELVGVGREALFMAARRFDETRGVPFRRWANLVVRGAMIDCVRRHGPLTRRLYQRLRQMGGADAVQEAFHELDAAAPAPTPQAAEERLDAYMAQAATAAAIALASGDAHGMLDGERTPTPEDVAADRELLAIFEQAIATLPEQERHIVSRHYFGDATIEEAAAELGLSKSWGSRLHKHAIESLTRRLQRLDLHGTR